MNKYLFLLIIIFPFIAYSEYGTIRIDKIISVYDGDTFRADIDYSLAEAQTTYGLIGIKVWICRGEVYGKRDLMLHFKTPNKAGGQNQKRRK